jgi:hypothetical protein
MRGDSRVAAASRGPVVAPFYDALLVVEGDSLQSGSSTVVSWAEQARWAHRIQKFNVAEGGDRIISNIVGQGAAQVDTKFVVGRAVNIASLWAGINDVKAGGGATYTAEDIYNGQGTWGLARKAAGFYTVCLTVTICSTSPENETKRQDLNALRIANADGAFDLVIDLEGLPGDPNDGLYFDNDHLHLTTNPGQSSRLAYIQPYIETIVADHL